VKTRHDSHSGLALFAAELRAFRVKAGFSQEGLGERINFSPSLVAMVEGLRRAPTLQFAQRCDDALGTPGTFTRLQQFARKEALPSWFQPYADIEATATQLRSWQPAFVEGLLQTEDYARAVLSARPNTSHDDIEQLVTARMARQVILDRPDPPLLWAVIDEGALHRRIGSEKIMRDQFLHLAQMALRPNITIEVVPFSAGGHYALLGALNIIESDGAPRVGYLETANEGYIVETPATIAAMMLTFDTVRAETLSRGASLDFIRNRADTAWT